MPFFFSLLLQTLLSLREIIREEDQNTRVTLLEYLKQLHPVEWENFVKDTKILAEESAMFNGVNPFAHDEKGQSKVDDLPLEYMEGFVKMIAPLMPHLAEELWSQFNESETITYQPWPTYDEKALVEDEVEMIVQVNGKVRAKIKMAKDADNKDVEDAALANEHVHSFVDGKDVKKVIVIPNRIVNIVVK